MLYEHSQPEKLLFYVGVLLWKLTVIIPSIIPVSALEGACSRSMAHLSTTEATRGLSMLSSLKPVMLTPL